MRVRYTEDPAELLDELRARVARVTHDINNPLTVIAGNAQLLMELIRALELSEELEKPLRDIQDASLQLAASLHALNDLKEPVERAGEEAEVA